MPKARVHPEASYAPASYAPHAVGLLAVPIQGRSLNRKATPAPSAAKVDAAKPAADDEAAATKIQAIMRGRRSRMAVPEADADADADAVKAERRRWWRCLERPPPIELIEPDLSDMSWLPEPPDFDFPLWNRFSKGRLEGQPRQHGRAFRQAFALQQQLLRPSRRPLKENIKAFRREYARHVRRQEPWFLRRLLYRQAAIVRLTIDGSEHIKHFQSALQPSRLGVAPSPIDDSAPCAPPASVKARPRPSQPKQRPIRSEPPWKVVGRSAQNEALRPTGSRGTRTPTRR